MNTITLSVNPGTLSHELRTPLTNILHLVDELSRHKQHLAPSQQGCIDNLRQQGDRLLKNLNDLIFSQYPFAAEVSSAQDSTASALEQSAVASSHPLSPLPILVADDEKIIRFFTARVLEEAGYQVEVAEDGYQALELYQTKPYAAIITDINMPMSGLTLAEKIRQLENGQTAAVPIIALTADVSCEIHEECLGVGMTDIIQKPAKSEDLLDCLAKYLAG